MVTGEGIDSDGAGCPDAELLVELASGRLAEPTRGAVQTHVGGCAECRQVLLAFSRAVQPPSHVSASGSAPSPTPAPLGLSPSGTLKIAAGDPRLAPSGSHRASQPAFAAGEGARRPGHVKPGDVLVGKYRVERVIGLGGMGVVVAATHLTLGQAVAIKLMLPQAFASPDANARFLREARAAAQIQGEHVAAVRDVGTLDDGAPFMVMELLRGSDLSRVLLARGPLPVDEVVDYVLQACEALAEAHAVGIVHRDLKPANLFLAERPDGSTTIKVLDFGISKAEGLLESTNLTHSRSVMGTPRYMSPEQMRSTKMVGPATDVWAIGCIVHELLTGRPPFDAETAQGLAIAIASDPTPSTRSLRADVSPGLEEVIRKCLEKDVSRRIGSVGELARALAPIAPKRAEVSLERIARLARRSLPPPGQSIAFAATLPSSPPGIPLPPAPFAPTDRGLARSTSESARGKTLPVGLVALVAVLAAGGFWYWRVTSTLGSAAAASESSAVASTAPAATAQTTPSAQPVVQPAAPAVSAANAAPVVPTSPTPAGTAAAMSVAVGARPPAATRPAVFRPKPRATRAADPQAGSSSDDLDDRK